MKYVDSSTKPLLARAEKYLAKGDYEPVFFIATAMLEEMTVAAQSGDDRNKLNPDFENAFYFGGDLIYRFDLRKEKQ